MSNIPLLKADDIECRVQQVKESWDKKSVEAILLLYKDARCDMKYLDEIYGSLNWKRSHKIIGDRLYCTVSVRNPETGEWIDKEDVGTESNTEKEKGQASDAFKRACFNIGIGRELYTSPLIKITLNDKEYYKKGDRYSCNAAFKVQSVTYDENRVITGLIITDRFGNIRFKYENGKADKNPQSKGQTPKAQAGNPIYADADEVKNLQKIITDKFGSWNDKAKKAVSPIMTKYGARSFETIPKARILNIADEISRLEV